MRGGKKRMLLASFLMATGCWNCAAGFHAAPASFTAAFQSCRWQRWFQQSQERICLHAVSSSTNIVAVVEALEPTTPNRPRHNLPPWLRRFEDSSPEQVQNEISELEMTLLQEHGFSEADVADVVKAIYLCAAGDVPKILGSVAFCRLLLQLEEGEGNICRGVSPDVPSSSSSSRPSSSSNKFVSKDVILASVLHYSECVSARYDGVYERVQQAMERKGGNSVLDGKGTPPALSKSKENDRGNDAKERPAKLVLSGPHNMGSSLDEEELFSSTSASLRSKLSVLATAGIGPEKEAYREIFSAGALRLADQASKLKRAEIMAHVLLSRGSGPLKNAQYADMMNLLVSLSDNPMALAIRCVASLYRLDGVLSSVPLGTGEYLQQHRSQEATVTAKDSLRLFAALAHRLGLQRLKSNLEANAFRILYPRQYSAASTLFHEHEMGMKAVSAFLQDQLTHLLIEDRSLMYELQNLQIASRVKEPYSFWKKLLKKRVTANASIGFDDSSTSLARPTTTAKELSVAEVNDGVALRVILKARKLEKDESEESIRGRERLLCYHVQKLVRSRWPETEKSGMKDYIRFPKPNGYQSLHHNSKISRNGNDFHFEVQIRTEEMHRIAEFGVAAHWTYKADLLHALPSRNRGKSTSEFEPGSIIGSNDSAYIQALEKERENLAQTKCYVFLASPSSSLEGGRLLTLSAGATVLEAIEELKDAQGLSDINDELQILRNGGIARLEDRVSNGDMLLVQTKQPAVEIEGGEHEHGRKLVLL